MACLAIAPLASLPSAAFAATINLLNIAGTGARNFTETAIWDPLPARPNIVPASGDFPVMDFGDGINDYVFIDSATTVQRINVGNLSSSGLEIRSGATLSTTATGGSQSNIGPTGTGYLRIKSGATLNQSGLLLVGLNASGVGQVTLESTGTHTLAGALTVGSSGKGTYDMLGGTLSTSTNLIVGNATGSTGIFSMQDGMLTTGNYLQIGNAGTANGAFKQSGGVVQINRSSTTAQGLFIAFTAGTTGLYEISGGSLNVANTNTGILNGANAAGGGAAGTFRIIGGLASISVGNHYDQRKDAKLDLVIDNTGLSPINLGGNAILDGTLSASFATVPLLGQQFTVMNYSGTRTGTFAAFDNLVDSPLGPDTVELSIDYGSGSGSSIVLTVIPEPSAIVLFMLAAIVSLPALVRKC